MRVFLGVLVAALAVSVAAFSKGLQMLSLPDMVGFRGGFAHEDYAYLVPGNKPSGLTRSPSGIMIRVKLNNAQMSYEPAEDTLDLTKTDPMLKGFRGAFEWKKHAYLAPYSGIQKRDAQGNVIMSDVFYTGRIARVTLDHSKPFHTAEVKVLNLTSITAEHGGSLAISYAGCFNVSYAADSKSYGIFIPYMTSIKGHQQAGGAVPHTNATLTPSGTVTRVDLNHATFDAGAVTHLDLTSIDSGLKGFRSGFGWEKYAFLVPGLVSDVDRSVMSGKVARLDMDQFPHTSCVGHIDLSLVDKDLVGFSGGVTDHRYGYLIPRVNSKVARFKMGFTSGDVTTAGVVVLDLKSNVEHIRGFRGGFLVQASTVYLVPYGNKDQDGSGKLVQINLNKFNEDGLKSTDLSDIEPHLKGFSGGFTTGHWAYLVPYKYGVLPRLDVGHYRLDPVPHAAAHGVSLLSVFFWTLALLSAGACAFLAVRQYQERTDYSAMDGDESVGIFDSDQERDRVVNKYFPGGGGDKAAAGGASPDRGSSYGSAYSSL